jgi:hypothetical protein
MQNILSLLGFDPRIVQPIANSYNGYAILALNVCVKPKLNVMCTISVFIAVNESLKVATTVKLKVVSILAPSLCISWSRLFLLPWLPLVVCIFILSGNIPLGRLQFVVLCVVSCWFMGRNFGIFSILTSPTSFIFTVDDNNNNVYNFTLLRIADRTWQRHLHHAVFFCTYLRLKILNTLLDIKSL